MKRQIISILLVLTLILGSLAALASCDGGKVNKETEAPTEKVTEAPTKSEETANNATEASTQAPTGETAEVPTEESASAETDAAEIDTENDTPAETLVETETETESETEKETETETDPVPVGPAEPSCDTCSFKTVKGYPICQVCGYVAPCLGKHDYTYDIEGHWKPACEHCGKASGKSQNHEYELVIEDEGDLWLYSFVCPICEFIASEQEVPYEISEFYSAGDFLKMESSGLPASFYCQAGIGYTTYASESGGSVTVNILKGAEPVFPSGKILVMKVRLGASQKGFSVGIKSANAKSSYSMNFTGIKSGWATIIVDLTKAVVDAKDSSGNPIVKGFAPDAYENYYLTDLSISAKAAKGESFDIAYTMICDTMEIASAFVEGDMNIYVYNDIVNEDADIDESVCVDENGNPIIHEYIGTETGHTLLESCTQCGLAAVKNAPHTYTQMEIDGELTYACSACKWLQFGYNINKYFSAQDIVSMATTYYQITNKGVVEGDDVSHASFAGKGNTAQVIFSRDNNVSSDIERAAAFDVGKANLFVMRIKTNTPAVSFAIAFRSAIEGASQALIEFPLNLTPESEWATYVVDLETVIPNSYIADEKGNYKVGTFYYHIGYKDFTPDVTYDIEFMAFVDEWDEVKALVSDEQIVNVTSSGLGQLINTADRSCVGEHAFKVVNGEEGWALRCASCGIDGKVFGIGSNVDLLMPAEVLKNVKTDSDGKIDLEFMEEDGDSFIRLSNLRPNGAGWMGLSFAPAGAGTVTGQYMIIKVRLGENGLGDSSIRMYTGTTVGLKSEGQAFSIKLTEDNEWHYVVVDLKERMEDPDTYLVPNEDGSYTVKYLQMRPFYGMQAKQNGVDENGKKIWEQIVMEDDYLDIGYIAYVDDLADLKDLISTETYEWSISTGASVLRNTADNSCAEHTPVVTVDGKTQTVACDACQEVLKSFTVPESINWFSPLKDMGKYVDTLSIEMFDDETLTVFNRYTGTRGNHLNLTGGGSSGSATAEEFPIGKYVVLKYRASGVALFITVGAKNESGYKTTLGKNYHTDVPGDEWRVAVLSLEDATYFAEDEDGKSTFYVMMTSGLAEGATTYTVDIAYVAIVDSIDEAELLLEEGEGYVYYGTMFESEGVFVEGSEKPDSPTEPENPEQPEEPEQPEQPEEPEEPEQPKEPEQPEQPAEHVHKYTSTIEDGKYVCVCACGESKIEFDVSDRVEGYLPAEVIAGLPSDSDGKIDLTLKEEDGVKFVRMDNLTVNNSGWMGINLIPSAVKNGKYIVIKLRNGENGNGMTYLPFYTGTVSGLKAEGQRVDVQISEDNEWHYIVIDVAECIQDPENYWVADTDGGVTLRFMQMRPIASSQGKKVNGEYVSACDPEDYIDIAFIAFLDDISEIGEVVDVDSYEWAVNKDASAIRKTSDNSCIVHGGTVEINGSDLKVVCGGCNQTVKDFKVPESVNWYSPLANMNNYVGVTLTKELFDAENLVVYNRYNGEASTHLNITGGTGAGTWTADKVKTGAYIAIKYRAAGGKFEVQIATKDFGAKSEAEPNRPQYSGFGSISGDETMGDWKVAVIKIPEGKNYTLNSEQEIGIMLLSWGSGAYTLDISYVAVLDSIDELEGLLGAGENYYYHGASFSNEPTLNGGKTE